MKLSSTAVYGLRASLIASHYPMQSGEPEELTTFDLYSNEPRKEDLARAIRLGNTPNGAGHDNYMNGIIVQFNMTAPVKIWTESDRYHFFDFVSSQSTIHRIQKMEFNNPDKSFEVYTDDVMINRAIELQERYNANPTHENFLVLIHSVPVGTLLTARMTTNYRQLKTIYSQRCYHILPEWHDFCDWVKTLPYAVELGVCGKQNSDDKN